MQKKSITKAVDQVFKHYVQYQKSLPFWHSLLLEISDSNPIAGYRFSPAMPTTHSNSPAWEHIVFRKSSLEQKIAQAEAFCTAFEDFIHALFPSAEDRQFIVLYFLECADMPIRARREYVLRSMPYLSRRTFYRRREEIYARFARALGLLEPENDFLDKF